MMIKNNTYRVLIFITILIILLIGIFNLSIKKVRGNINNLKIKRGYILDRNMEPLAITLENYKAYYLIKDDLLFSNNYSPVLKKYLNSTLNLPKKGLILLSDNLSLDEIEELKKEKNVIIEKNFKRKILDPHLTFLIGETFNGYGVYGLERIFDKTLQKGKPVILSLDYKIEKKLYKWAEKFKDCDLGIALFDLKTGELLAYIEKGKDKLFNHFYASSIFRISEKNLTDFEWTLTKENIIEINHNRYINLWYLAKVYMDKVCNGSIIPKLVYTKEKDICKPDLESFERKKQVYFFNKGFISVYLKNNKMLIFVLKVNDKNNLDELKEYEVLNKKFDNLAYRIL